MMLFVVTHIFKTDQMRFVRQKIQLTRSCVDFTILLFVKKIFFCRKQIAILEFQRSQHFFLWIVFKLKTKLWYLRVYL